jgi:DNA-binding beta-propeller fold protein YncE
MPKTILSLRNTFLNWRLLLLSALLPGDFAFSRAAELLQPEKPLVIPDTHGRFDFLAIDLAGRRLLAAHTANSSLDVIDLDRREVVKIVPTGTAQCPAVDAKAKRYYVGVSNPPQLAAVDSSTLEVVWNVPLSGPADLIAVNPNTGYVYVGHDDAKELWVIDPAKKEIIATLELPGEAPEDLAFDAANRRLFQSIKTTATVAVIDVSTHKVIANWPTAPAQSPHGMAIVEEAGALLTAGANGKLTMMSQEDGHVIATAEIPERVDQIAYDAALRRVYCASATGKIAIVGVEKDKLINLGSVDSSEGAKSIAVDPKTHTVWIAYAKGETSVVQAFTLPGRIVEGK